MNINPAMAAINTLLRKNPQAAQAWKQAQEMMKNKTPEQQQAFLNNMLAQRGITQEGVVRLARQYGINL